MAELEEMAARVEREEPRWELWKSVLMLLKTGSPSTSWYDDPSYFRFTTLIGVKAWRDAAAMLMPPNCSTSIEMNWSGKPAACANAFPIDRATGKQITLSVDGYAEEPHAEARATLACALRVHSKLRACAASAREAPR